MRYLWDMYHEYLEEHGFLTRLAMRGLTPRLRQWDVLSANRVDHFAANSATVAGRIQKHYRREATVIHPPVDVAAFTPKDGVFTRPAKDAPYLCLGQLVGYKRADIAVKACTETKRPLVVIGDGPLRKKLEAAAGPTIRFLGWRNSQELERHIHNCKALLFPGEEDFGIVPVEVQAAGRPVIAYRKGGALETVREGVSGFFFDEQTAGSLIETLDMFERRADDFDPAAINEHANTFAPEFFDAAFMNLVETALAARR
jgi:glycosyltransferase involved in cell wall biosynthesis